MRIIGYLDRKGMIVTVFKNDNKLSVKFEMDMMEQIFKFREDLYLTALEQVNQLVDETMMEGIIETFARMALTKDIALGNYEAKRILFQEEDII